MNKDDLTEREIRLLVFSLGRLENLMSLMAVLSLGYDGFDSFSKDEIRELAKKLGANID